MVFFSCCSRASMESPLLLILAFLCLAVTSSHAAVLPSQVYWNSILPKTPMPKAIRDVLRPGGHKGGPFLYRYAATEDQLRSAMSSFFHYEYAATEDQLRSAMSNPFRYGFAATEDQLHANPTVAIFFFEKDILSGAKINLQFIKNPNEATFSSQSEHHIILSSKNLPDILNHFSVKPESVEAQIIKNTIKRCEAPAIKGEEKHCATSLESMIDFTVSKLGKQVQAISTEVEKETGGQKQQEEYTVGVGVKKMAGDESVVCHKEQYPYAVFYCHVTQATSAYTVPLVGADGTTAKAVAVCHTDTSEWNPKHLAFQVLKVKPGAVPICHFLPEDHIIWVPKQISAE